MVWLGPGQAEHGALSVAAEGILATTPIATPEGWRVAGGLCAGARVLTFDRGVQPLSRVLMMECGAPPSRLWPLVVPAWALDNREVVTLLPEQKVLIEADVAEGLYGDPFALVPAQALEGWRGIARRHPPPSFSVVQLGFESPQVIYASRGLLLSCPGDSVVDADWTDPGYCAFSLAQAQHLVACLMAEDAGAALRQAAPPPPRLCL